MRDTGTLGMNFRSSELFKRNVFTSHLFDGAGARDEHLACFVDLQNEIAERRRVGGPSRTTPLETTCSWKIVAYPLWLSDPSCILAPAESTSPIRGTPAKRDVEMVLAILPPPTAPTDPPNTVASLA